jgi:hypothetical protein
MAAVPGTNRYLGTQYRPTTTTTTTTNNNNNNNNNNNKLQANVADVVNVSAACVYIAETGPFTCSPTLLHVRF